EPLVATVMKPVLVPPILAPRDISCAAPVLDKRILVDPGIGLEIMMFPGVDSANCCKVLEPATVSGLELKLSRLTKPVVIGVIVPVEMRNGTGLVPNVPMLPLPVLTVIAVPLILSLPLAIASVIEPAPAPLSRTVLLEVIFAPIEMLPALLSVIAAALMSAVVVKL